MTALSDFPCLYPGCGRTFRRQGNLTTHYNIYHRELTLETEPPPQFRSTKKYHPKLNGIFHSSDALDAETNQQFLQHYHVM